MPIAQPLPPTASLDASAALDRFSTLLAALYRIPLQMEHTEAAWQAWLGHLASVMECNYTVLILRPPSMMEAGLNLTSGPDYKPAYDRYNTGYYSMDPFVNLPVGLVVTLSEYVSESQLQASEFYRFCLQPSNVLHVLGIDLPPSDGLRPGLRLCRPPTAPAFNATERSMVERLAPHLQQAMALHQQLDRTDLERNLYAGALTQLSVASLLLDSELQILATNAVADRWLAERDGVTRTGNTLTLAQRRDQQQLRELVASATAAQHSGAPTLVSAMPVERPSGRAPLGLIVRPLPASDTHSGGPSVSIFISDPEQPTEVSTKILSQLFGLTSAEARLALRLANGLSLEQAATELGITRNTGRAHLRSIFTKTGVAQQSQLVSLILKSAVNLS